MRQPAWLLRAVQEAAETPEPWPAVAEVVQEELRRRERARARRRDEARRAVALLAGLSSGAWLAVRRLDEAGGREFLDALGHPSFVRELRRAGLVHLALAADEEGRESDDVIVSLRHDVELSEGT